MGFEVEFLYRWMFFSNDGTIKGLKKLIEQSGYSDHDVITIESEKYVYGCKVYRLKKILGMSGIKYWCGYFVDELRNRYERRD